jgi:putative endonuclease
MLTWFRQWFQPSEGTFGNRGEHAAEAYLRRLGYQILDRQHRNAGGEVDLVALDGETVVFVEVKTRQSSRHGLPADAVTREKQRRLTRAAATYLKRRGWLARPCRFDVVSVLWSAESKEPQITHYRHAFEASIPGQMY